jgi:hypothetical protein
MPRPKPDPHSQALVDRRAILLGSAVLATPVVVPCAADAGAASEDSGKANDYQETDHIRRFYAKCRF